MSIPNQHSTPPRKAYTQIWRSLGVIAAAVLATTGCNANSGVLSAGGTGAFDLTASVAADEPRAAVVGRDVLAAGGTAADAAVAMGLTMAVTLPARAGLGGGGICLIHDPDGQPGRQSGQQDVRALDFLPRGPAGSDVAVPGTPRGLYALHAAYGRLRWERLVAPVEGLARIDRSVSRAAALDFADFEPLIAGDAQARRIFMASGPTPDEGQPLAQLDLAGTLGQIRQHGVGVLHSGPLAERIARASGMPADVLRAYRPAWTDTDTAPVGNAALHFAAVDGRSAAGGWRAGVSEDGDRASRVLDALRPASAEAPPTAGLAVLDEEGQAVVCAFSMGGPFGTREMVPGTGIFLARPTGAAGIGGPVLLVNPNTRSALFGAAGSTGLPEEGPAGAEAGLVTVAVALLDRGAAPADAVAAMRIAPAPAPSRGEPAADGIVLVERSAPASIGASLQRPVAVVPTIGRVNLFHCTVDRTDGRRDCRAQTDPRGFGLALMGY